MASSTLTGLVATSTPVEHVKVIAFNRPEKRNALSQALIDELLQELSAASKDDNIHAIVITGNQSFFSGESVCACHSSLILLSTWSSSPIFSKSKLKLNHKSFKAGADIKEIQAIDTEAAQKRRYLEDLCNGLQAVRKPLIAAVEGMAVNITLSISRVSPHISS